MTVQKDHLHQELSGKPNPTILKEHSPWNTKAYTEHPQTGMYSNFQKLFKLFKNI